MNFLTSKIRPMYFKYLVAAFGSALISSIYGVVDMAMVGQAIPGGGRNRCFSRYQSCMEYYL